MKFRELYRRIHEEDNLQMDSRGKELLVAYVEGTTVLESAFHSDNDFWKYADHKKHYPSICKLRMRGATGTQERAEQSECRRREGQLKIISSIVNEDKRNWEKEWYDRHNQLIIIGDVSQKLKTGFSPVAEKQYSTLLALNNLYDFLNEKVLDTMPFNFWFAKTDSIDSKRLIFCFIRDKIASVNELSTDLK
jgi:hypothetical protein